MSKPNIYALLCVILALEELKVDDKGSIVLNKEQLDKTEAELKKLQSDKAAVESSLSTAKIEKETAETALSAAIKAMDELDATVKEAKDPAAKVEAIRAKLAAKPAVASQGALRVDDHEATDFAGSDPINAYAKEFLNIN